MNTPRPPRKLTPSIKTPEELLMNNTRRLGLAATTVAVPGFALMERDVKLLITTFSLGLQVTKMKLLSVGFMDARAAVMVAKVPGATPLQSTVALLANISPGARRNSRIHRHTLNPEVANFMIFSLYM